MALDLPGLAFALTSGALTLLSPCAYPMLPGYILYYMGKKTSPERVLLGGVVCTLGLLSVFTAIGVIASALGAIITPYVPLLGLVSGAVIILLGVSVLTGVKLPALALPARAPRQEGLAGIFLYGVAYGLASLGCSAQIFFSTLFFAITRGGPINGVMVFAAYAAGMGLPLVLTTILTAKAKELTLKKIIRATPRLQRISGVSLVIIGVYSIVSFYYTYVMSSAP